MISVGQCLDGDALCVSQCTCRLFLNVFIHTHSEHCVVEIQTIVVAHEVRNVSICKSCTIPKFVRSHTTQSLVLKHLQPIASAMAACAFVKSSVNEKEPLITPEQRQETREDVEVIDSSLRFVNDLLRNMLDMHRSSAAQLNLKYETTDILHDILEPVGGMVYRRDGKTKVIVECERGLCVEADCLRLKQVVLNLARNANKFVTEGFIRLRGYVVDNSVRLSVEDSGCGIPESKRVLLFAKFQESLDVRTTTTTPNMLVVSNCPSSLHPTGSKSRHGNWALFMQESC